MSKKYAYFDEIESRVELFGKNQKVGGMHVIAGVTIETLKRYEDDRGWLAEIWRDDKLCLAYNGAVMAYVSFTKQGVIRGPHEHTRQTDLFVFLNKFRLTLWDARKYSPTFGERMDVELGGDGPAIAIVPPGVVHAYQALENGLVVNLPDELYKGWNKKDPVDEIRHESNPNSPYKVEEKQ